MLISTDDVHCDQHNPRQPNPPQAPLSQSTMAQHYWKPTDPPQALQQFRVKGHSDQVAGDWPSWEDEEDLHVANEQDVPQAQTQPTKEEDNTREPIDLDEKEHANKHTLPTQETPAAVKKTAESGKKI